MAHPYKKDSVDNEARRVDRLDLPDAGALSGEGRLQKMKLHAEHGGNPAASPAPAEDGDDEGTEDEAEDDLE